MLRLLAALSTLVTFACAPAPSRDGLFVIAERGDARLLAGPMPRGPEQSDVRPARALFVERGGVRQKPSAPVWAGAMLDRAVAWVRTDGVLVLEHDDGTNTVVDEGVLPELAASPSGARLAYTRAPGQDAGVYRFAEGRTERVSGDLVSADRPLFVDDDTLIVVGARRGEIAGVFVIEGDTAPRRLTNDGLRIGTPFLKDARFISPPAHHDSMRMDGGVLVYFDGVREQRVALGGAR